MCQLLRGVDVDFHQFFNRGITSIFSYKMRYHLRIRLPCGSLNYHIGAVVENGTVFHLKKFAKLKLNKKKIIKT
jgi:hypothetical protein